jgi:hypothetical protein
VTLTLHAVLVAADGSVLEAVVVPQNGAELALEEYRPVSDPTLLRCLQLLYADGAPPPTREAADPYQFVRKFFDHNPLVSWLLTKSQVRTHTGTNALCVCVCACIK